MKIYTYTADTASNTDDGVFGGYGIREAKGDHVGELSGSGLFGFGTTHPDSASLFNTSSIIFTEIMPSELSFYEGNYDTSTIGTKLTDITASSAAEIFSGGTTTEDEPDNDPNNPKNGEEDL